MVVQTYTAGMTMAYGRLWKQRHGRRGHETPMIMCQQVSGSTVARRPGCGSTLGSGRAPSDAVDEGYVWWKCPWQIIEILEAHIKGRRRRMREAELVREVEDQSTVNYEREIGDLVREVEDQSAVTYEKEVGQSARRYLCWICGDRPFNGRHQFVEHVEGDGCGGKSHLKMRKRWIEAGQPMREDWLETLEKTKADGNIAVAEHPQKDAQGEIDLEVRSAAGKSEWPPPPQWTQQSPQWSQQPPPSWPQQPPHWPCWPPCDQPYYHNAGRNASFWDHWSAWQYA